MDTLWRARMRRWEAEGTRRITINLSNWTPKNGLPMESQNAKVACVRDKAAHNKLEYLEASE